MHTALNLDGFNDLLLKEGDHIILFYADWAVPSMELLSRLKDEDIMTVDVENNADVAHICGLKALPTLHYFRDGQIISSKYGLISNDLFNTWSQELKNEVR